MSKLLQGRLPLVSSYYQQFVDVNTFNRFVRILEISLDRVDPDEIPVYTSSDRDELKFQTGSVIWNTTENVLQVYLGNSWQNISTPTTSGLDATASLGEIQVITNGSIVVEIG